MGLKYPRTYHFPFSKGLSGDDKRVDLGWWEYLKDHELILTEKLDGQNNSIYRDGVFARSHSSPTTHPWDRYLTETYERIKNLLSPEEGIYGESLYAIHSIEYQKLPSYFFMFAARDEERWYSWDEVTEMAEILQLPTVPVLERRIFKSPEDLQRTIEEFMKHRSTFGDTIEGVVVRISENFLPEDFSKYVIKYVRENHVQTDTHWTKEWKKAKLI